MFSIVVTALIAGFVALAVLGHILVLQALIHGRNGRPAPELKPAAPPDVAKTPASEESKLAA